MSYVEGLAERATKAYEDTDGQVVLEFDDPEEVEVDGETEEGQYVSISEEGVEGAFDEFEDRCDTHEQLDEIDTANLMARGP